MVDYTAYKLTSPDGKVYIGITSRKPKERWDSGWGYQSNQRFTEAIQKYGWNGITKEIVQEHLTEEEASELERKLIKEYDSCNPEKGYNILEGGKSGYHFHHTEEAKEKISQASTRLWQSEEHRKKMSEGASGKNNPFYGKHHSEETRQKMLKWHKEHPMSEEQKRIQVERLRKAVTGTKRSKESIEKSAKAKWKPILQYTKDGEFVRRWDSAKEASETLHIHKSTISQCCKGTKQSAGGFVWRHE